MAPTDDFTALLAAWRAGDQGARDRLVGIVYPELRAIARRQLANERGVRLSFVLGKTQPDQRGNQCGIGRHGTVRGVLGT